MSSLTNPAIVLVRAGPAATAWVAQRIQKLQAGDPLRPVAGGVPSHHAGLHLRRRLAAEGYATVRFMVLAQLAEALGARRLAAEGSAPLTAVTRDALIRGALRVSGGPLAQNAEQAGLVDRIAALAADLRRRAEQAADTGRILATGTATSRAAVRAIAEYERRRLENRLYEQVDLLEGAAAAVEGGAGEAVLRDVGAVVVHLPARLDAPEAALLRSLARHSAVVVALPAVDGMDDAMAAARLGVEPPTAAVAGSVPQATARVVIASDPIEEVRAAVRDVLAALERDVPVPLHRTAIVYRDEETYGAVLRDTLRVAGIVPAVLGGRPLLESVAASGLLGLIRLRDQDFARPTVLAWLSGLPHESGVLRTQARWDLLSRIAGVVRGAGQWRNRLTELGAARAQVLRQLDADRDDPTVEARCASIERDIEDARRIVKQVAAIDLVSHPPAQATWQAYVEWALRLRDEFLTPDAAWSAEDREASQMVEEVVRGLAAAQEVEPTVSVAVFLRALEGGLRARRRPEGRLGSGVVIGAHRLLLAMDFDRVHVLGVVEASFPAAMPVDPLLADDPLRRREEHEARERRDWLVALAAADGGEVLVSVPLVDSEGRAVYPSPWLLELLADGGSPPPATAVRAGTFSPPRLRRAGGGDRGTAGATPLHLAERREWEAAAAHRAGLDLTMTPLARRDDLPLGRALSVVRARRSARLTEFDGNLAADIDLSLIARGLSGEAQSASGVQTWATCPFRFLLGRVLVVAPTEDVEDERWWQIDAAERGSLIHRILEQFFAEVAQSGQPPPGVAYADEDVRRMEAIAAEEFALLARRGAAGHPLVWENERAAILADLRTLLRHDAEQRGAGQWRPAHLEQPFGIDSAEGSWPPVTVALPDRRSMTLRGFIDRVDRGDGGLLVIDYKTGRDVRVEVSAANRLSGGRALQLPLYARAARDRERAEGRPAPTTNALYWFCTTRGGFAQRPVAVDDGVEAALDDILSRIDSGVRSGCFPQVPGEFDDFRGSCKNCQYCDYDSLCPAGRDTLAAVKAGDAGLEPYRALQPEPREGEE